VKIERSIAPEAIDYPCSDCNVQVTGSQGVEIFYMTEEDVTWRLCRCCAMFRIKEEEKPSHDPVNHPSHYNSHPSGVECIEITRHYSCMIGAAMKYLWRAGLKPEQSTHTVAPSFTKEELETVQNAKPGEFVSITKPVWKQNISLSKGGQCQDLNKAIFCIMEEIDLLGGEVTARPREKKS